MLEYKHVLIVLEQDPKKNPSSEDPYLFLGVEPGASFEEIQIAKQKKLSEAGEDPIQKAKVEAAYDSLLMVSLKERQLGKLSNAAASASKREEINKSEIGGVRSVLLTRLKRLNSPVDNSSGQGIFSGFKLPLAEGLMIRTAIGVLVFVLLLISPDASAQLILSFSVIGLFVSQIRRGRKFLPSLLWSFSLLSIGLLIGGLLVSQTFENTSTFHSFSSTKLESLPALVLIYLGSLFLE